MGRNQIVKMKDLTLDYNRVADRHMVDELRRLVRNESFDELPMTDLNSEAVDFRAASECFEPVRRLKRRDLETLRLIFRVMHDELYTVKVRISPGWARWVGEKSGTKARRSPKYRTAAWKSPSGSSAWMRSSAGFLASGRRQRFWSQ